MTLLVHLFKCNKKVNLLLLLFSCYCLALLIFRAKITNSIYLFFLIWNLVLAVIPYAISTYLSSTVLLGNRIRTAILVLTWLLFLPNSFYIITDLVHIVRSSGAIFYLDLVIICSFATVGFLLGIHSLIALDKLVHVHFSKKINLLFTPVVSLLCGFGIFIGRILRYNSWDIVSNPLVLITDLATVAFTLKSMAFSFLFGSLIYISYLFKQNKI